jgi:hypothetical protein
MKSQDELGSSSVRTFNAGDHHRDYDLPDYKVQEEEFEQAFNRSHFG